MRPPVCPAVPPEIMQMAWAVLIFVAVLVSIMVFDTLRRR
jgi:hypothetical protein